MASITMTRSASFKGGERVQDGGTHILDFDTFAAFFQQCLGRVHPHTLISQEQVAQPQDKGVFLRGFHV